jgi:hypothetical protein
MRFPSRTAVFAAIPLFSIAIYAQTAKVDSPAPDFTATDSKGQTHALEQYRGEFVVL